MAKKYSRQLVIESVIIGALLIAIASGGVATTTNIPPPWQGLQNPELIAQPKHDLSGLALYYNTILTDLGTARFENVSNLLGTFSFVSIPQSVNQTAQTANSEISSMNVTIARAVSDFNRSANFTRMNLFVNASSAIQDACAQIKSANATFAQFQTVTTPSFSGLGVPVVQYAIGANITASEVAYLESNCRTPSSSTPPPSGSLTISSPQKAIFTGGNVALYGNLTVNGKGLAGQSIYFYANGTYIGSARISKDRQQGAALCESDYTLCLCF